MTCIFISKRLIKCQADIIREKKSRDIWVKFSKLEDKERTIHSHREESETGLDFPICK